MLKRLIGFITAIQLLLGCSALQHTITYSDTTSLQNQRSAHVELELLELEEVDTLIKLNNRILSDHIEAEIRQRTALTGRYKFQDIKLNFKRQLIHLESIINVIDDDKNTISVATSGEILLRFGGDRLEWFPRFTQLEVTSRDFNFQDNSYTVPTPALTESTLRNLISDMSTIFIKRKNNSIPLNIVPLGEVKVGASLPGLSPSPALPTQSLAGAISVIDKIILIDSPVTIIALDLAFTPGRTPCPPGPGCTTHSELVHDPRPETIITHVSLMEARKGFAVLKEEFETRTADFSISKEKPDIALIEISRIFLQQALRTSLADITIDAKFNAPDLLFPKFSALLQPFETDDVICEQRECPSTALCTADFTQCKRLRDTRDCSTCVFRNPLNNRCVSEEIDQECVSEQTLQNARFDAERAACIKQAETMKRACDEANAQSILDCQLSSDDAYSSCTAFKRGLENLGPGASLATISAQTTQASGKLVANFSNFRIENDLGRLKLDLGLKSDLQLNGELRFKPGKLTPVLANCISPWNGAFKSRFTTMPTVNNLMSKLHNSSNELTAHWSGFGLTLQAESALLAPLTASSTRLLSNCNVSLKPGTAERALSGEDAAFFLGQLHIETQPLPTTIHFSPATITLGDRVFSGSARLTSRNLVYKIAD